MAYTTLSDVRALSKLSDSAVYPDAEVTDGIAWATSIIDDWCGTSFEAKASTEVLDGNDSDRIFTGVANLISVTSASVDAVAVADVSGWTVRPGGVVVRDTGLFSSSVAGQNVSITVSAGAFASVPADIELAAKQLSRWYVLRLSSEAPDNAISMTTPDGAFRLNAMPGGKYGPTSLPEVNATLNRRSARPPSLG